MLYSNAKDMATFDIAERKQKRQRSISVRASLNAARIVQMIHPSSCPSPQWEKERCFKPARPLSPWGEGLG